MTVSRVVNQSPTVSDDTRKKVLAAIRELGYVPNLAAQRLAAVATIRLGLLFRSNTAPYLNSFLLGALEECATKGHELVVQDCGASADDECAALNRLVESGVTGVVLPPPLGETGTLVSKAKKAGIIVVVSGVSCSELPSVQIDDHEAAREMTNYLLSLGHRRIGFIEGPPEHTVSARRLRGFVQALREAGLDPKDAGLVETGRFCYRSGLAAAGRLLQRKRRPTAIFAANDDMAAAVLATAQRLSIPVPAELSVAGFDDSLSAAAMWPPLTTVQQPIRDMGRNSIRLLLQELMLGTKRGRRRPPTTLLRHTLIRRGSTTPR